MIITYHDFLSAAQTLSSFRASQGLRAMTVDVQDVYDEFGYGIVGAAPIHDFLAYAYAHWQTPAPSYVVLLGDGNYDPKNYSGYATPRVSYIPPYLANVDPWILETAADNRYVTLAGNDTLPDMMLGRLSVNTAAEANAFVNKIIAYEQNPVAGDWKQQVLAVADNADSGGNFSLISDNLLNCCLASPYTSTKVYYGVAPNTTKETARAAIQAGINAGKLIVNYIGHAYNAGWAEETLLTTTDVPLLSNGGKLPVVLAMTCYEGYYIFPDPYSADQEALGEVVTRADGKGAVASWSPTGLGVSAGHDALDQGFFNAVFRDGKATVGEATIAGKINLWSIGSSRDLLDTYLLFGDPATRLPISQSPAINVVKSSTTTSITAVNQVVSYTFTVANAGNVTLSGISVTDPKCSAAPAYQSGDANSDSKLQKTESWIYTCSHTVTQAEMDAGGNLSNTVTADSTKSAPATSTKNIPISQSPAINVVKSSTTTSITAANQVVPYTFTLTNAGNVTLSGISVVDPKCDAAPAYQSGDANSDSKLQKAETWIYTCSHTVTQAEMDAGGNLNNTATANSTESAPATSTKNIPISQSPAINVVKSSTTTSITAANQVVPYTFTLTNAGNVTLSGISVVDPKCDAAPAYQSGDANSDSKLQKAETWIYTCSHTVTQAEMDAGGNLNNTATADSTKSAPATSTKNIPISPASAINVLKSSTTTSITAANQVVPYTFTLTNAGNVTLSGISVVDPKCDAAPAYQSGDTNSDGKLQKTETWIYTCSHTVTQAEMDAGGNLSNTVTADSTESAPATSTKNIPISPEPGDQRAEELDDHLDHGGEPGGALHLHCDQCRECDPERHQCDRSEVQCSPGLPIGRHQQRWQTAEDRDLGLYMLAHGDAGRDGCGRQPEQHGDGRFD